MMPSTLATVLGTAAILLLQAIVVGGSIYLICRLLKRRSAGGMQEPIRTDAEGGKVIPVLGDQGKTGAGVQLSSG